MKKTGVVRIIFGSYSLLVACWSSYIVIVSFDNPLAVSTVATIANCFTLFWLCCMLCVEKSIQRDLAKREQWEHMLHCSNHSIRR